MDFLCMLFYTWLGALVRGVDFLCIYPYIRIDCFLSLDLHGVRENGDAWAGQCWVPVLYSCGNVGFIFYLFPLLCDSYST